MNFVKSLFSKAKPASLMRTPSSFTDMNPSNSLMNKSEFNKSMLRVIEDRDSFVEDIFENLKLSNQIKIPDKRKEDEDKLTVFLSLDDILVYNYLPDENLGFYNIPKFKNYDLKVELKDYKTFAYVYFRDHLEEFVNYLNENCETILYSTGEQKFVDKIIDNCGFGQIFRHRLYQDNCHFYKNTKADTYEFIKDINLITNRSLKRKILLECSPLNHILSPDNSNNI